MIDYGEQFSGVERLLIMALIENRDDTQRRELASSYREWGDDAVYASAVGNKVLPMVSHGLMDALGREEIPRRWSEAHDSAERRLTAYIHELDRLAAICDERDIRVVAIENGGIARGVQQCRGCFASSDIEILVNRNDVASFDEVLEGEGYERRSRQRCASESDAQWDRDSRGWENYGKTLQDGQQFWLNVQWRAVLRRWVPMESDLRTADLIARSVPVRDTESRVRILAPEDNLLVCALHVASHSYVRGIGLRLQLDVDRLVNNVPIDWDRFLQLAAQHKAEELLLPSLIIPANIFGTPIPEPVIQALVPSERTRTAILSRVAKAGIMNRRDSKFTPVDMVAIELALSKGLLDGIRRVFFPPATWIREAYDVSRHPRLAACYVHRLLDLARRREA